eukprot:6950908-Pyramimonas_sp.AAC.1
MSPMLSSNAVYRDAGSPARHEPKNRATHGVPRTAIESIYWTGHMLMNIRTSILERIPLQQSRRSDGSSLSKGMR